MKQRYPNVRDVEARNALVVQYLPLVGYVYQRLRKLDYVARLDPEDGFQAGTIGLIRAAEIWDEAREVKFSTYAFRSIMQHVLRAARQNRILMLPECAWKTRCPVPQWIGRVREDHPLGPTTIPVDPSLRLDLAEGMRTLHERDRLILQLRYTDGLTLKECGQKLGTSREAVRQLEAKALAKLRRVLGDIAS